MDAVLNVLFYIPLGVSGVLALGRRWWAWLFTLALGCGFSWLIEWLQLWSPFRYGNLTDLASNAAGTGVGAMTAYFGIGWDCSAESLTGSVLSRWRLDSNGKLLLGVWLLWQMFPFVPAVQLSRLTAMPELLGPWSWRTLAETFLGFGVLRLALGRSPWLWIAYAALAAQAFLLDRSLSPPSLTGAGLGWIAAASTGASRVSRLGLILPVWLAMEELRPFSFQHEAKAFAWAPFGSWFEAGSNGFYPIMFGKLFLYASTVWSLRERSASWVWAIGIPAAILAGGEWVQRYIPGRTPESTDFVLLFAGAVLLALSNKRERSKPHEVRVQRE